MERDTEATGIVFGIQRFSIHDGPGIRTTVFLKGCNLNCAWCHNPESIPMQPIMGYSVEKCINCGGCVNMCAGGYHVMEAGLHVFNRSECNACGNCTAGCSVNALELIGKEMTAGEVFDVLIRDKHFYGEGGGVTISGGEALLQKKFVMAICKLCKDSGLHCAIESNGAFSFEIYEDLLSCVDLFMIDYKATDSEIHRNYVGCESERILSNIRKLHDAGAKVLVRCPIIPGINDNDEHFSAIAKLSKDLQNLVGVEILPYHKFGVSKARRIGIEYTEYEMPSADTVGEWKSYIQKQGGRLINEN